MRLFELEYRDLIFQAPNFLLLALDAFGQLRDDSQQPLDQGCLFRFGDIR